MKKSLKKADINLRKFIKKNKSLSMFLVGIILASALFGIGSALYNQGQTNVLFEQEQENEKILIDSLTVQDAKEMFLVKAYYLLSKHFALVIILVLASFLIHGVGFRIA